jgi:hypothetical protein
MTARDILQETYDNITAFLLDHVSDDVLWEDAYPDLDELRSHIGELLAQPEGVES